MQKLLGILTRPPVPFVLGVLLALVVVWFGGHFLQVGMGWPSTPSIAVACGVVVGAAVLFVVLRSVRARQKARAIENEIRNQGRAVAAGLPPGRGDDLAALQQRFDEALAALQQSKLGRSALYAMPWFVVIGPPGSGKTTAITESGLNFPAVKGPGQKRGVRGVGGTRNCDWWFTDQAILLDTAGRYTTQAEDRDEWLAFLGMLKKARKQKPINGALVAISITDVLAADDDALERHATTIRQRIDELVKQLEVVFPVYLMLTKCDLLDGFVEFFQALSKEERAQVWGTTFQGESGGVDERFAAEFAGLRHQVELERLRLLVADRPALQQQKIFALPLQLRAAQRKLTEFVRLLTQPNPYSDASELRGVYLTSGTQEGAPIDLVLQKLSAAFGMPARADAGPRSAPAVEAKSYFLRDLFTRVMQADKDLARSSAKVQRRRELGRKLVIWGSAAAALVLAVWSVATWWNTRSLLDRFAAARAERVAITSARDAEPPEAAQRSLGRLRDAFAALWQAYGPTQLLGPRKPAVVGAMQTYAEGVRTAFLEPMARHVSAQLQEYVAATDRVADYTRISQLVTAYAALDRGYVPSQALHDALEQQNLWRWSPAQLGKGEATVDTSEASRHLDAYVAARAFEADPWLVGHLKDLLGRARERLASGAESQNAIRTILERDPQARAASEQDLLELVRKQLPDGTTEVAAEKITAERRLVVMQSMARIGLADSSSLPKVIESLMDLDAPESAALRRFQDNLESLRLAGAAPRPGLGRDATREAYAAALAQIASLRPEIDQLVRARQADGGYLLPDALAKRSDWTAAFAKRWLEAQQNVDRQLQQIDKLLEARPDGTTESVSEPIRASLNGMFDSIAEALAREARSEMQAHWQKNVGVALATAAERFPCRAGAEAESAPAEFVQLFKPGGALTAQFELLARLRSIKELASHLEPSDAFDAFAARVAAIQAACFSADAPAVVRLQFRIAKIVRDSLTNNVVLTIAQGNDVSTGSGSMERIRNQPRAWQASQTGAMLLLDTMVELPNNQTLKLTIPRGGASTSAWSLLRVLGAGVTEKVGNDAKVTWTIPFQRNDGSPAQAVCWIQFEPIGADNPLHPNFFAIEPPAKIFRDGP